MGEKDAWPQNVPQSGEGGHFTTGLKDPGFAAQKQEGRGLF
jgi:hypothetical protein